MKEYKTKIDTYTLKKLKSDFNKVKITKSQDSYEFIKGFFGDDLEVYESVYILLLNRANITEGFVKISQGGTAGTVIDVKIVAKYAIDSLCHGVILAHNHPSGTLQPSEADKRITDKIKQALILFDIALLDHIILTENSFFSFADEGII